MSETTQTSEEVFDSLTGFDEIAITQAFGTPVSEMAQHDQSMFLRALVFTVKRRGGASDTDAHAQAMGAVIKDILGFFADEDAESGKDEPPAEPQPETSPSSSS